LINTALTGVMSIKVNIDRDSGFCFGVQRAVRMAEEELQISGKLFCLGDIVHNHLELDRLKALGLKVIDYEEFRKLRNVKVLIRAHGEPPDMYMLAQKNDIKIIDATCPIVSRLQKKIRMDYKHYKSSGGTIFIYGKNDHPEVRALVGQTRGEAKVIRNSSDLDEIKLHSPIYLFSQTTMNPQGYKELITGITERVQRSGNNSEDLIKVNDTICKHVSHRQTGLEDFVRNHEIILFISSRESSNGNMLFELCKSINQSSFFITEIHDLKNIPLRKASSIGICGATSTPLWLLEKVRVVVNRQIKVND
jgi:4-hydroxy-3-methylbut-2-en-1-yl diphosphate reductase